MLNGKDEETEELIKIFVTSIKTAEKRQKKQTNAVKLRSEATSLFDVHLLNQPGPYE